MREARVAQPGILRTTLASAWRIEWSQVEPLAALRCTVGVGVSLLAALLLNQPAAGVFLAVGAVAAGFGSYQGAYRSRAATMLFCAVGMAFSLFVGSLAGHSTIAMTIVAAMWGLAAGLFVAVGPAASFVALQSAIAVLIAGAYPAPFHQAMGRGLLVLLGGLVQIALVVTFWPLKRFRSERRLVASVYRSLADYAESLPRLAPSAPEPHTLTGVAKVQTDPQPFARSGELLVFRALLDEAERIRASLAALSLSSARTDGVLAEAVAIVIREIADAVDEARAPAALPLEWDVLNARAPQLRATSAQIDALLGQVRAACRMATLPAIEPGQSSPSRQSVRVLPPIRDALMTLVANVSRHSTAWRHAVRLAVALAIATSVSRLVDLPRGYWMSMATLLVLKPGFRDTVVAGITRILGTLTGAGLAALFVHVSGAHPAVLSALLLVFAAIGYAFFRASYTMFTVGMTGYIVLLLYLAGAAGPAAAVERAIDTVLGGVLALAIYRIWPTWESRHVGDVLATLAEALARDAEVLLGMYIDPARWNPESLLQSRAAARLARSNAEASVERMQGEPAREGFQPDLALGMLAAFRRYALGALALHAGAEVRPAAAPQLSTFREQIVTSLQMLAAALRRGALPEDLPPLRQTLVSVEPTLQPAVAEAIDMMVDSVNSLAALTRRASPGR